MILHAVGNLRSQVTMVKKVKKKHKTKTKQKNTSRTSDHQSRVLVHAKCPGGAAGQPSTVDQQLDEAAVAAPVGEVRVHEAVSEEADASWPVAREQSAVLQLAGLPSYRGSIHNTFKIIKSSKI